MTPAYYVVWPQMGPLVVETGLWLGDTPIFFDMGKIWYNYVVLPQ